MKTRREKDAIGYVNVPSEAYYGSETKRSLDNYRISGIATSQYLIYGYAIVKKCAAMANLKAGKLDKRRANAIVKAADEIMDGKFRDQFQIDVFQSGAGTSINMNVNEVIANRAIEILGGKKGNYKIVHPNDHVNMSQSTNDTYPTTVNLTLWWLTTTQLIPALKALETELNKKTKEFHTLVKVGRTHLQDAVPIRLGEEFEAYAGAVKSCIEDAKWSAQNLLNVPIGGTAVGTGINAGDAYTKQMISELSKELKVRITNRDIFTNMSFRTDQLHVAGVLEMCAICLTKICNDLRLMGSGPRAGLNELVLPAVQPGSSIMPGKINPSMAEMLGMVCMHVMGSNHAVRTSAAAAQLELNVFTPVTSFELISSIELLSKAVESFTKLCVKGIKANEKGIGRNLEMDMELATALNPYVGYAKAAEIANKARDESKSVMQVCLELGVLDRKTLEKILDPKKEV